MKKFSALIILALTMIQSTLLVAKDAKIVPAQKSIIDTLSEDARDLLRSFADATGLNELSAEKLLKIIESDAKVVAANIDGFLEKVSQEIEAKKPELQNIIKTVQNDLTKVSDSLKKLVGPDATKKAEELKIIFEKNLQAAIEPINTVIRAVKPDAVKLRNDLEASAKVVLDSIIDGVKKVEVVVKGTASDVANEIKN
ncbi:uncharacterized protein LOC123310175 [Coccinella septempunctata]|uniref:uncharacterized protein LOC123310175 n=1 Tax=Coccinella septempunctata TaxID=41139 RepID=UPI001D0687F9|nr:uncharacterized protein LOC123310175 [Coccinella septempunctata]